MAAKHLDLFFGAQTFNLSALSEKIAEIKRRGDVLATEARNAGELFLDSPSNAILADNFTKLVCKWGGGNRVYANLHRHHGENIGWVMAAALRQASCADNDQAAIEPLIAVKGLSTSFASKHLRLLAPQSYGTLDSRLHDGLGFALNAPGYAFFMRALRQLAKDLRQVEPTAMNNIPISMLEQSIFEIVRARARTKSVN